MGIILKWVPVCEMYGITGSGASVSYRVLLWEIWYYKALPSRNSMLSKKNLLYKYDVLL